jgi:hypothetical protein
MLHKPDQLFRHIFNGLPVICVLPEFVKVDR